MLLTPDGDEIEIINAASAFLEDVIPLQRLHQPNACIDLADAARCRAAEMGWFGLVLPVDRGGSGFSSVEHVLFFREVGRRCGPLDILTQSLAVMTASGIGMRVALLEGRAHASLAVPDGEGIRVFGRYDAPLALYMSQHDVRLLDMARARLEKRPSLNPAVSTSVLDAPTPPAVAACADPGVGRLGRLGVAAMLVGVAEATLDLVVEYAKIRETFGRPIGAYQAVRHPCADMALRVEAARCQLWYAAAAMKEGRHDVDAHIDAAKHLANEAAVTNADVTIQLHGGIGVTDEHDAHLFLKHALLLSRVFGSRRVLLARLLEARVEG